MASIAYIGNTNNLELTGLKSELEDTFLNNLVPTVTVKDADGNEVSGGSSNPTPWPADMTYVEGSDGNYAVGLSATLEFAEGGRYTAFIDVIASDTDGSPERIGHWEFPFTAKVRTK